MRLFGKRPVLERLKIAPRTIRALTIAQQVDAAEVVRSAKAAGIRFTSVSRKDFVKLTGELHAQGILAEVDSFSYVDLERILLPTPARRKLFFLDRVTDPQNLGNILRSLACLGGFGLVLPRHESVEVNETVLRVACGGENYVPVAQVTNLVQAALLAKKAGYWVAGASASGGESYSRVDWPTPLAVVLGSEGAGIRPGLLKHLDFQFTLPMPGAPLSFNVATAAALIAYEIIRRQL